MRALVALASIAIVSASISCSSPSADDAGSSSVSVTCAKSEAGCRCANAPFELADGESPAKSCVTPPGAGTLECCADIDSSGKTGSCQCLEYLCFDFDDGTCGCSYYGSQPLPTNGTRVDECVSTADHEYCCSGVGYGCECQPPAPSGTPYQCSSGTHSVDGCAASDLKDSSCTLTSCDDVTYAPPSSGGSGGGNGGCTYDSECHSCSECNACRNGSCVCGHEGSSGSCVY